MNSPASDLVKAPSNEPHNLLARLYREIGVSAVAAALEPMTLQIETTAQPALQNYQAGGKAAA